MTVVCRTDESVPKYQGSSKQVCRLCQSPGDGLNALWDFSQPGFGSSFLIVGHFSFLVFFSGGMELPSLETTGTSVREAGTLFSGSISVELCGTSALLFTVSCT